MKTTSGLLAAALCCTLSIAPAGFAAEAEHVDAPRLELSRTLTRAPTGSPPINALGQPANTIAVAPAPSSGLDGRWLLLLALLPALLWWRRRATAPRPAAQVAGPSPELQTLMATNATLERDLRRAHTAGRGEWDSTLATMRDDLATARRALDQQLDRTKGHLRDASEARAQVSQFASRLEQSETQLSEQTRQREHLEKELTDTRAHIKSSEANAANAAARAEDSITETLRQRSEIEHLVTQIRELQQTQHVTARQLEEVRERAHDYDAIEIRHRAEISKIGDDLAQSQTDCEQRDGQIGEFRSRLATKDQELTQLAEDHQSVLAELRARSQRLRASRDKNAGRIAELEAQLDEQQQAFQRLGDEHESATRQRDEEIRATTAQLSEQRDTASAERDRLQQVLADASAELHRLRRESGEKLEEADRRATLAESTARDARAQWNSDRARAQEAQEDSARAVAVAEAAAGDLARGLTDAQARIAELDMDLRQKTERIAELDEQLASAGAEATSTDAQLATVLDSVQEYKESTRNKIINIAKKFDAMLIQRNELERQLQRERQQHAANDDLELAVAEKDKIIARLGDDLDDSRQVIDALKSSTNIDAPPADNRDPDVLAFDAVRRDLTQAQLSIKSLGADLRVRNDLIRAYEEDTSEMPELEDQLASRASTIAVLQNELSLAVAELARAKSAPPDAVDEDRLDALQKQLGESQKHGARQAEVIAHLEEELLCAVPPETVEEHLRKIDELQQDLRASSSLIRHLEQEVANLRSDGSRALPDAG